MTRIKKRLHIDFETYSQCNLGKSGAWRYSTDETTTILCMAYGTNASDVKIETDCDEMRKILTEWLESGGHLVAWNSFFEMSICYNVLKIKQALKFDMWIDPSATSAYKALPRGLGDCAIALGLSEQKNKTGKALITYLCKPHKGKRRFDDNRLQQLMSYCIQDVKTEIAVHDRLGDLSPSERDIWILDQKINTRGISIDVANVDNAIEISDLCKSEYNKVASKITGNKVTELSKRQLLVDYVNNTGFTIDSVSKEARADYLKDTSINAVAKRLIELYDYFNKTSVAKYQALKSIVSTDNRARGLLLYHGATTGRWSGRLFQPQNLPRPTISDTDSAIKLFETKNPRLLYEKFGEPMEVLSSCLRGMLVPTTTTKFAVADYSSIEARILPWLAGQDDILEIFRKGEDIYKYQASKIYNKAYGLIDKNERFVGKVATLALGYGGGEGAFMNMSRNYGVEMDVDTSRQIKNDWRVANSKIVNFWWNTEKAVKRCLLNQTKNDIELAESVIHITKNISVKYEDRFLKIRLPSNRELHYYKAHLNNNDEICFYATNSVTGKFVEQRTYGGKLVENITQAVARDIIASAMINVEKVGFRIVLSIHDELITESTNSELDSNLLCEIMCRNPLWAEGLPLSAEGFNCVRYRK